MMRVWVLQEGHLTVDMQRLLVAVPVLANGSKEGTGSPESECWEVSSRIS